ncbi:MAG: DUF2461 domain-containing protein [Oscillospiraceae bacterium]|nr:DUF2461 domain-containing protein [Oscillospiraceae bacterium]
MFNGFTEEARDFLWGIALNNSREWFQPRKQIYVEQLYNPMKELAFDVQSRMIALYPEEPFNCKVTRIYRDARIPHRDGPYKTHLWFSLDPPRDPETHPVMPSLFFEIEGRGYSMGMDFYCDKPAVMEAFRARALREPETLEALTLHLRERPEYELIGPEYKRSKGEVGPLLRPWFNRKRLCVIGSYDWEDMNSGLALEEQVVDAFQWLLPFYQYFLSIG